MGMSAWVELIRLRKEFVETPTEALAERMREAIRAMEDEPPYHLRPILEALEDLRAREGLAREEVRILDHGSGGGLTLMYLSGIGYTDVHGVDIGTGREPVDAALRAMSPLDRRRVVTYDGRHIDHADDSVDFIFSQQVFEHVRPDLMDPFFAEEARILSSRGMVFHQIPHRWVPWESHTQTWLIHYLPKSLRLKLYAMAGRDPKVEESLFLRSPGFIRALLRRHFGALEDRTARRLRLVPDPAFYDGNVRIRRIVSAVASLPLLDRLMRSLVMLDIVASKPRSS